MRLKFKEKAAKLHVNFLSKTVFNNISLYSLFSNNFCGKGSVICVHDGLVVITNKPVRQSDSYSQVKFKKATKCFLNGNAITCKRGQFLHDL